MSQFGELALMLGDLHIPHRTIDIPEQFKELLVPGKIQHVLCTGNIGNKDHTDWIRSLANDVHIVRGDFDDNSLPDSKVINIGEWKIGLIHGYQVIPWGDLEALSNYQRDMDVDLLISGHTHQQFHEIIEGKTLLNPGSATGAYSYITPNAHPSFFLMAFQGREATLYTYELIDDEVKVNKNTLSK